jgi:hypothetical protein
MRAKTSSASLPSERPERTRFARRSISATHSSARLATDSFGAIASTIGNTTNRASSCAPASTVGGNPVGRKVSAKDLRELRIERDAFHGDWNYVVKPRKDRR